MTNTANKALDILDSTRGWHWSLVADVHWMKYAVRVKACIARGGRLPATVKSYRGPQTLGGWAVAQRARYRKGTLPKPKIAWLESVKGWVWELPDPSLLTIKSIAAKARKHPASWWLPGILSKQESGFLAAQRGNKCGGRMSARRKKDLSCIPNWDVPRRQVMYDTRWTRSYERVKTFFNTGSDDVQLPLTSKRSVVTDFLQRHRVLAQQGRLAPARLALLKQLPVWSAYLTTGQRDCTGALSPRWMRFFERVVTYLKRNKLADLPCKGAIYRWLVRVRDAKQRGEFDQRTIQLVETLPGWTWRFAEERSRQAQDVNWMLNYKAAKRLCAEAGGIPLKQASGGVAWIYNCHERAKLGLVPAKRLRLLKKLRGWDPWTPSSRDRGIGTVAQKRKWMLRYREAKKLCSQRGHLVLSSSLPIGHWINGHRQRAKRGSLPSAKLKLLKKLTGWT